MSCCRNPLAIENANRTRSLIDRLVLDHEALEEDFTTKKLALRVDIANTDVSMPLIYISTGGAVTVYRWLAKTLSERGVPVDVVNRFLAGLSHIDALFPARVNAEGQIQGFKAKDKNAGLTNVLPKFSEFERLLAELLQDIERRAAETV